MGALLRGPFPGHILAGHCLPARLGAVVVRGLPLEFPSPRPKQVYSRSSLEFHSRAHPALRHGSRKSPFTKAALVVSTVGVLGVHFQLRGACADG